METEAIILNDASSNKDVNDMDPDPFQNTEKGSYAKKPRDRCAKTKNVLNPKSKTYSQKSKRFDCINENDSIHKPEDSVRSIKQMEHPASEEISEFQNFNSDSSDNEVLSKKIIHSDREAKKVTITDDLCYYTASEHEDNRVQIKSDNRPSNNNISVFEENSLEAVKPELYSNNDMTSESEYDDCDEPFSKAIKVEKKKRHYILNSGRKKGLANRYKCEQCQHKFGHKITLEAHVRKVHEGEKKAFKCQLCDKAYSFIGGLSTHIRDVHERKQETFDCSVSGCEKKYSNYITLQRHVRVKHLNIETPHQYVCEQCGSTFKQSSNLRYHMKTRHPTEEDLKRKELLPKDRLECEECKKSFHSQYTLKYHKLRVHADEKKFECKVCGRRVAKQFMLDSHMLVHSDQKMACKFCGREFVRKYQVEAHIKAVHQKLKPFQCPHCSESFASRKTLRHHIYIHTGEKPYVCDICGQAYRQPTCLKNHRKIHNKPSANNESIVHIVNRNFISSILIKNDDEATNKN